MADTAPAGRAEALLEHADFVQRLARALCADEHRARDLVQDTWLAALRRPPRDGSRPRAWLAGVLRRLALQERRSEARRSAREEAAARGERQRSTGEIAAELEHQRRLGGAVLALPPAYREAILLRYYEALPARAVAEEVVQEGDRREPGGGGEEAAGQSQMKGPLHACSGYPNPDAPG